MSGDENSIYLINMNSPYLCFGVLVFLLTAGAPAENHLLRFLSKIGVSAADGWMGWMSFVAFSPDGTMVASDGPPTLDDTRGALTLWSFPEGRLIKTIPFRPEALSDDWKYCASDAGVIDMRTGEPLSSMSRSTREWTAVAFSSQSQYVAMERKVCKRPDCNRIRIAHLAYGPVISEFGRRAVFSLAFHPGGKLLASGHWDNVTLWNVESGQRIGLLRGFARYVTGIAFNHNGTILAAGTDLGGLQIWDVSTQNRLSSIDLKGEMSRYLPSVRMESLSLQASTAQELYL